MMKRFFSMAAFLAVSVIMNMTVLAGVSADGMRGRWLQEGAGWKWKFEDGSYAKTGWYWFDGNEDSIAERYFIDGNGYIMTNTTTADGFKVNAGGAWTENDVVQTRIIEVKPQTPVKNITAADIDPNLEDDVYNKYGVNKIAMDMVYQSREKNAKYGEVSETSKYGYEQIVTYQNGFEITYNGRIQVLQISPGRTDLNNKYLLKFYFDNHQLYLNRVEDTAEKYALLEELGFNVTSDKHATFDHVTCEFSGYDKLMELKWFCDNRMFLSSEDRSQFEKPSYTPAISSGAGGSSSSVR